MTLEKRIEALEKRCKRLGKTLVGVGTLALFAVVAGTAGWTVAYTGHISPKSITTKTIHLKDSAGKVRLRLLGLDGSIRAYNKAGIARLVLYGSQGIVKVNNSAGKTRLRLRGQDGSVRVYDSDGKTRIWLNASDGSVRAYDSAGKGRVGLLGKNGTLTTFGSNGKKRIVLGEGNGESMNFYDSSNKLRIGLTVQGGESILNLMDPSGAPRIQAVGTNGKIYFSAPNKPTISHP